MKRTTAQDSVDGLYVDRDSEKGISGTILIAEDRNNVQEEICNSIEDSGIELNGKDQHQLAKAIIALSRPIGEMIVTDRLLEPKAYAESTGADYCPVIPRWDKDHDITTDNVPQEVIDELNNVPWEFDGVKEFSATSDGKVLAFADAAGKHLAAAVLQAGYVNRWYESQENGNFMTTGPLFTGSRAFCLTVNGTEYEISGATETSITLATAPAAGNYKVQLFPHRIAGKPAASRLRRISGEALICAGDASGVYAVGAPSYDTVQQHQHASSSTGAIHLVNGWPSGGNSSIARPNGAVVVGDVSGARVSATTRPRGYGVAVYTHVRYLLNTKGL